jgi:hypothetical protein
MLMPALIYFLELAFVHYIDSAYILGLMLCVGQNFLGVLCYTIGDFKLFVLYITHVAPINALFYNLCIQSFT